MRMKKPCNYMVAALVLSMAAAFTAVAQEYDLVITGGRVMAP